MRCGYSTKCRRRRPSKPQWRRSRNEPRDHDSRLRLVRRRAARRAGLGRLRSFKSQKPAPALLDPAASARARTARRRSVLVDISPDLREQLLAEDVKRLDAHTADPSARRSHPWHRRHPPAGDPGAAQDRPAIWTRRPRRSCARISTIFSRRRPAANIRRF